MREHKHTPGPWALHESGFSVYYLNPRIEAGDDDIEDPCHDSIICDTRNIAYDPAFSGIPGTQLEANARLISAAPDLLAACELLLAVYAPIYNPTEATDAFSSAVIAARSAIAKATA